MFPDVLEDFFDEEIFRSIYKQAHGYEYLEDAVYITKEKCGRDPLTHKMKYKEVPKVIKKQVFVPPNIEAVKLILALKDPQFLLRRGVAENRLKYNARHERGLHQFFQVPPRGPF